MNEPELATQLPLDVVLAEDDAGSEAEFSDTVTEEYQALLEGRDNLEDFSKRIPEPDRTPVNFAGDEPETFDGEDNIIETIETPAIPAYTPPQPLRVEKRHRLELDHELKKAARKPASLKAWVRSEIQRGRGITELVEYAAKSDQKVAADIQYCYDTLDEAAWQPGDPA